MNSVINKSGQGKKSVPELITPAPPILILSNNHTFVLSHDISCVCMHPPSAAVVHLIGRAAGCVIVAGIEKSGNP